MAQNLLPEDKEKFVKLLGLDGDASHEQIVAEMKNASKAQDCLNRKNFDDASRPVLLWARRLVEQRTENMGTAYLFWQWFFNYDKDHNLGFLEAGMNRVRIIPPE